MTLQHTEEKEPKRPDFNIKGVAPFEKSDVKRGHVQYDYDRENATRQREKDSRDPTPVSKRQQTKEETENYLRFLNSKKYGSEGPLSGQNDSLATNTPGIQSHGNFQQKNKSQSGSKTKSRKPTDASYFKTNMNSNSTHGRIHEKEDQEYEDPPNQRNAFSTHELENYNRETYHTQNPSLGNVQDGYIQRPHHVHNLQVMSSGGMNSIPTRGK